MEIYHDRAYDEELFNFYISDRVNNNQLSFSVLTSHEVLIFSHILAKV